MSYLNKTNLTFDLDRLNRDASAIVNRVGWHPNFNQIGFTHSLGNDAKEAWHDGIGSLFYAWGDNPFNEKKELIKHSHIKKESDFMWFVSEFKDTSFYDVYIQLSEIYILGRMRLMMMRPKSCLSWHVDTEHRLHIPLITNVGARLVIEDSVYHMPADGSSYIADTTLPHTAFNAGLTERLHLVTCVLGYK